MCPYCQNTEKLVKRGRYTRPSDGQSFQRFFCKDCRRSFSESHFGIDFRLRKRDINQAVFRTLCSGVSQRRCAFLFSVHPETIARRLIRFGRCAAHNLDVYRQTCKAKSKIQLDEMISFEHSKCKPLTLPIAVETGTRRILAVGVGRIPANGHLAAIARKKYGFRPCERRATLDKVLQQVKICLAPHGEIRSDESKFYPQLIRRIIPGWKHVQSPGRRGCIVGQGELKAGGHDPLFSLNHTYAMIRDGLKRLSRRTWCTTKIPQRLELLVCIYAWFHNLCLDEAKASNICLSWLHFSN